VAEIENAGTGVAYISDVPLEVFQSLQVARGMNVSPFAYGVARLTYIPRRLPEDLSLPLRFGLRYGVPGTPGTRGVSGLPADTGLVIAAPEASARHEAACEGLIAQIRVKGREMGLARRLRCRGSGPTQLGQASIEPDTGFGPNNRMHRTIAIEVATADSYDSVAIKCQLWAQVVPVQAVVAVKLDERTRTITVCKQMPAIRISGRYIGWEVERVVVRRVGSGYQVHPRHHQEITLDFYDVTAEPPPPDKVDFVLDADFFCEWAAEVWAA